MLPLYERWRKHERWRVHYAKRLRDVIRHLSCTLRQRNHPVPFKR